MKQIGIDALVACVADGAGSSKFSNEGSAFACSAIEENANAFYERHGTFNSIQHEDIIHWCEDAREQIQEEADFRDSDIREFATTLCAAIVTTKKSFFFQIGDGAITVGNQGLYGVVFGHKQVNMQIRLTS